MQRRLFALGDDAIRAAWRVYIATEDREQLEDTLLRIARNDSSDDGDVSAVGLIAQLEESGLLSSEDADTLVELARAGHQVRVCVGVQAHLCIFATGRRASFTGDHFTPAVVSSCLSRRG